MNEIRDNLTPAPASRPASIARWIAAAGLLYFYCQLPLGAFLSGDLRLAFIPSLLTFAAMILAVSACALLISWMGAPLGGSTWLLLVAGGITIYAVDFMVKSWQIWRYYRVLPGRSAGVSGYFEFLRGDDLILVALVLALGGLGAGLTLAYGYSRRFPA